MFIASESTVSVAVIITIILGSVRLHYYWDQDLKLLLHHPQKVVSLPVVAGLEEQTKNLKILSSFLVYYSIKPFDVDSKL